MTINYLTEARNSIVRGLRDIHGPENVRAFKGEIAWIETKGPWLGLRWVYLCEVSGCASDFIRLRNNIETETPKTFWPFRHPNIRSFELTVLFSEITQEFISDFSSFVSFLSEERDEVYTWDLFDDASYPCYGFSEKALARQRENRK